MPMSQEAQVQSAANDLHEPVRKQYQRPTVEMLDVGATSGKLATTVIEATSPGVGS